MAQEAAVPLSTVKELARQIAREEVAKFARSGFLQNATISEGGLTIKGGALRVITPDDQGADTAVYFGDILGEQTGDYLGTGLLIQGQGGEDIASFRTDAATGGTEAHLWSKGKAVVATDPAGGLRYPLISGGFGRTRYADFSVSTTSGAFETLWDTWVYLQQPRLEVGLRATTDASGVTGEVQVLVNGAPLGSTTTEGFSISNRYFAGAVTPNPSAAVRVEIRGRRTSSSGALRIEPMYWAGRPSGS